MAPAKVSQPRNRKAQDLTLINLRALKARVKTLEQQVKAMHRQHLWFVDQIHTLKGKC